MINACENGGYKSRYGVIKMQVKVARLEISLFFSKFHFPFFMVEVGVWILIHNLTTPNQIEEGHEVVFLGLDVFERLQLVVDVLRQRLRLDDEAVGVDQDQD